MESSSENTSHLADNGCTLVVMAKAPRTGLVKTRLAKAIPIGAVTELYGCLLDDTLTLARSLRDVEVAILCPASDVEGLTQLTRSTVNVVAQTGDGLAAGLTSVFEHFTARGRKRVVAFNSDSPHLPATTLRSAFETLAKQDVVVGPTHDGGYYLVGAKSAHPGLFESDGIGTQSALEALLARARELQLSAGFTDPFYDVDVEADLVRLAAELRLAPDRAPRTAAWLNGWPQTAAQLRTSAAEL
jgi:uncharacterized protein